MITADSKLFFLHVCFIQSSTELLSGFNQPSPPLTTTKNLLSFLNHLLRRTSTTASTKPRGEDVQRAQSWQIQSSNHSIMMSSPRYLRLPADAFKPENSFSIRITVCVRASCVCVRESAGLCAGLYIDWGDKVILCKHEAFYQRNNLHGCILCLSHCSFLIPSSLQPIFHSRYIHSFLTRCWW